MKKPACGRAVAVEVPNVHRYEVDMNEACYYGAQRRQPADSPHTLIFLRAPL